MHRGQGSLNLQLQDLWILLGFGTQQRFSKLLSGTVTYMLHKLRIRCVRFLLDKAFSGVKSVGSLQDLQPNQLYFHNQSDVSGKSRGLWNEQCPHFTLSIHRPGSRNTKRYTSLGLIFSFTMLVNISWTQIFSRYVPDQRQNQQVTLHIYSPHQK